jgi:hypothetical protein
MQFADTLKKVPAPALWLGLAGLVPFWLPLVPLYAGGMMADGRALLLLMVYAAIILSFLGGIRWGAALKLPRGPLQSTLFVLSVLPSLAGFAALVLPSGAGLILLIVAFMVQGAWDVQAAQNRRLPPWFATLRAILTAGAVIALVAGLVGRMVAG